jgi:hypothetical protein
MARTRSIRPEFWNHPRVIECAPDSRLLLIGLWANCDDGGRHPLTPKAIKGKVFPADPFTAEQVEAMLKDLLDNGLIDVYQVGALTFLEVVDWGYWVKVKRPKLEWPDKSGSVPSKTRKRVVQKAENAPAAPPEPVTDTTTAPKATSKPRGKREPEPQTQASEDTLNLYTEHLSAYEAGTWRLEWGNPPGLGCTLPESVQAHMLEKFGAKELVIE